MAEMNIGHFRHNYIKLVSYGGNEPAGKRLN